jgi:hypothetical protein
MKIVKFILVEEMILFQWKKILFYLKYVLIYPEMNNETKYSIA